MKYRFSFLAGILITAAAITIGFRLFLVSGLIPRLDAISSNPNSFIRHFSPTWRSIKKIADVPYILAAANHTSSLPAYSITLSVQDQVELLLNLPDYPREYKLLEDFKKTVIGTFSYGSYTNAAAEIRYRGVSPNHWNAIKKSLQVNLPLDAPLEGRTTYRFFIGEDKGWVKAMLWNHIAEKLGIMALDAKPIRLSVNGKDVGVYILIEGWEPSLIARYGKPMGPLFSNQNVETDVTDLWRTDQISQWYNRNEPDVPPEAYPELAEFLRVVADSNDSEFASEIPRILNMEAFLRWSVATVLSGNFHQGNIANMNFYFNPETRKFEPILFDATPSPIGETVDVRNHRLVNRLLRHEAFRKEFEKILREYVSDNRNLDDDLAFYDREAERIKLDIFADTSKVTTSKEALSAIALERDYYRYNYLALQAMLQKHGTLFYTFAEETYPLKP